MCRYVAYLNKLPIQFYWQGQLLQLYGLHLCNIAVQCTHGIIDHQHYIHYAIVLRDYQNTNNIASFSSKLWVMI
jgi:hypothetical protein